MSMLSNGGTYRLMKRYYNLQLDFNRRSHIHGQNCHAAPEQTTSSHVPRQRKLLPPVYTNVQPVFDIEPMSITGCTFVDMDREVVFSVGT